MPFLSPQHEINKKFLRYCKNKNIGDEARALEMLESNNIDVNLTDIHGQTSLHYACIQGNKKLVEKLLEHPNIGINIGNDYRETPLHLACFHEHEEIVEMLLNHSDIDPNPTGIGGRTPLHYMSLFDRCEKIIKWMLKHPKIEVNKPDNRGIVPLHIACARDRAGVVNLLLNHPDIHVDFMSCFNRVPLLYQKRFPDTLLVHLQHRKTILNPNSGGNNWIRLNLLLRCTLEDTDENKKECAVLLYMRGFKPENPESNNLYQNWLQYNDNKNQYYHELHQKDLIATTNPVASLKELSIFAANKLKNIPQWYPPMLLKMPTSSLKGMLDDFIQDGGMQPGYAISKPGLTRESTM